jgi:hypothetical protein
VEIQPDLTQRGRYPRHTVPRAAGITVSERAVELSVGGVAWRGKSGFRNHDLLDGRCARPALLDGTERAGSAERKAGFALRKGGRVSGLRRRPVLTWSNTDCLGSVAPPGSRSMRPEAWLRRGSHFLRRRSPPAFDILRMQLPPELRSLWGSSSLNGLPTTSFRVPLLPALNCRCLLIRNRHFQHPNRAGSLLK